MSLFNQKLEELIQYCDDANVKTIITDIINNNDLESGLKSLKSLLKVEKQKLKNRTQYLKNKLKHDIKKLENPELFLKKPKQKKQKKQNQETQTEQPEPNITFELVPIL